MRLAMGKWFLYLNKVGSKTRRQLESWVDNVLGNYWVALLWRCHASYPKCSDSDDCKLHALGGAVVFFFQILWLGYGEGEENVWRWWYLKSLTHLCLYTSFYIIYSLTWILQESSYSPMFSRKAWMIFNLFRNCSILMMHLDWTRAMQSGGHKVGCSKSGRAWRLCLLDSWFEMLATLPPFTSASRKRIRLVVIWLGVEIGCLCVY